MTRRFENAGQGLSTQRTGQIGVNVVERIILKCWRSRWQPLDAHNDDGIDGLIFLEDSRGPTGQIIFAQIKCHKRKTNKDGDITVGMKRSRLWAHASRWRKVAGAAILIAVDPATLEAHWTDVKNLDPTATSTIVIPRGNELDKSSKGLIAKLCGTVHRDLMLPRLATVSRDYPHLQNAANFPAEARKFYSSLKRMELKFAGSEIPVHFSKAGWKHITRGDRKSLLRFQSYTLLGVIPKLMAATKADDLRPFSSDPKFEDALFCASAAVSFPHRQTAIVKAIFKLIDMQGTKHFEFHTIYESRRRRDVLGVKIASQ